MTRLENDSCIVEIALDDTYETDIDFNGKYDIVINPLGYSQDEYHKAYAIHVFLKDKEYSVALIGDYNCWDYNCGVIDGEVLTVLQGWEVTQFNITTAQVTRSVTLDIMAPNFEIHRVNTGYLIYGETDITMLNNELETMWSFSGYDIFASSSGKKSFEIKKDRICLYDFEDNYYELDFHGKVICRIDA